MSPAYLSFIALCIRWHLLFTSSETIFWCSFLITAVVSGNMRSLNCAFIMSKMKPNKAPGIDNFNSSMLREVSSAIASPLCEIFNGSIEMGEVPLDWKKANVTPIYKNKGTKSQPCNYRPVSLTSHISKTMKSIIRDEIIRHLPKNELIKPSQHGFWKGRSCLTNLLVYLVYRPRITCRLDLFGF